VSAKPTLVQLILNATTAGKAMLTAANEAAQKTLLSLQNVDNTSDSLKPVSTAQLTAIRSAWIGAQRYSRRLSIYDSPLMQTAVTGAGVAGFAGNNGRTLTTGATAGAARFAHNNGSNNNSGFTFHEIAGKDNRVVPWGQFIEVQCALNITAWNATASGYAYVFFGVPAQIGVALGNRGIGLIIDNARAIKICAHNGTALTTGSSVGTAAASASTFFEMYRLCSDGVGNVSLYRNGVLLGSISGGPTTDGSQNQCGFHVEIGNGGQSLANTLTASDFLIAVAPTGY